MIKAAAQEFQNECCCIGIVTLRILSVLFIISPASLFAVSHISLFIQEIISLKSAIPFSSKVQLSHSLLISAPLFL